MASDLHHSLSQRRDGDGRRFARQLSVVDERKIVLGRLSGRSCLDIAAELGVSPMTVSRYARRAKEPARGE